MSDSKRNEMGLLCDVLGLESLVDEITSKQQQLQSSSSSSSSTGTAPTTAITATPSAILGPFYRADAPLKPLGSSILGLFPPSLTPAQSQSLFSPPPFYYAEVAKLHASCLPLLARMSGRVRSATTSAPITSGAVLEVWQSAPNGLYEQQDNLQPDMNLRGRFATTTATATTSTLR